MKEGVDKLPPSAFTSPKQPLSYTRDISSNAPDIKYYEQTRIYNLDNIF